MRALRNLLIASVVASTCACDGAADSSDDDAVHGESPASGDTGTNDPRAGGGPSRTDAGAADATANDDAGTPAAEPDIDTIPWETGAAIGNGVAHKDTQNPRGDNAAIFYGGYTVGLAAAQGWATALYRAELRDRGVRQIWAVQGPNLPQYDNQEIGNSKIAALLVSKVSATTKFVLVAGHSSGAFVAHELLRQLAGGLDPANVTANKVVYFDLDGGESGLTATSVARLRNAYFVSPFDKATGTRGYNTGTMQSLGATYASKGGYLEIDASSSGCNAGAYDCVHITLVNAHPHDPAKGDAFTDYASFDSAHPVDVTWLEDEATQASLVK